MSLFGTTRYLHAHIHTVYVYCNYASNFSCLACVSKVYFNSGDTTATPPADDEQPTEKKDDEQPTEKKADDTPTTEEPKVVKPVDESAKEEETTKTDDTQSPPAEDESAKADDKPEGDKEKEAESNVSTNTTAPSNVTTKKTIKLEVVKEELEVEVVAVDVTPLSTQAVVESKTK